MNRVPGPTTPLTIDDVRDVLLSQRVAPGDMAIMVTYHHDDGYYYGHTLVSLKCVPPGAELRALELLSFGIDAHQQVHALYGDDVITMSGIEHDIAPF